MKPTTSVCLALLGVAIPFAILAGTHASSSNDTNTTNSEEPPMSAERTFSSSGYDITRLDEAKISELASKLSPEAFEITQKSGTERPFCGTLLDNKKDGTYVCVVCNLPLFSSEHKFTSGTGWPSFYQEYDADHVRKIVDTSHGMVRTEIECARCGAHLGHVFEDGPKPTGMRHCLNSASLEFVDEGTPLPSPPADLRKSAVRRGSKRSSTGPRGCWKICRLRRSAFTQSLPKSAFRPRRSTTSSPSRSSSSVPLQSDT